MTRRPSKKAVRRELRRVSIKAALAGVGRFVFANNTKGDYCLPRATTEGRTRVGLGQTFIGDSYYFCLVQSGDLRLVQELKDESMTEKLLTEQPPTVKSQGVVEYVLVKDEPEKKPEKKDEATLEGVKLLFG